MTDMFAALAAPFPPEAVSWRVGQMTKDKKKARALAYIDARDVMRRLDQVCGPHNWQCAYTPMPNGTTCCSISIRVDGEWISKANGAGATDIEGEKGGYSDAFKRAAVLWGIGQYLYDLDSPWVALDDYKRIDKSELPALHRLLTGQKEPSARSSREEYTRIETALRQCKTLKALHAVWTNNQEAMGQLAAGSRHALAEEKDRCKAALQMEVAA